jgi:hypothetical protein
MAAWRKALHNSKQSLRTFTDSRPSSGYCNMSSRIMIVKRQRLSLQQSRKLDLIRLMHLAGRIAERRGRRSI